MTPMLNDAEKAAASVLVSGGTLGEARGVTPAEIDTLEALAVAFLQERKFERAENCLRVACLLSHSRPGLWERLGDCRRLQKDFGGALFLYGASRDAAGKPSAWLSAKQAICHLALGEMELASVCLAEAERLADGQDGDGSVRTFLEALLASFQSPSPTTKGSLDD
jgi:tetratricopeptide (TPR) repeat protein